MTFLIIDPGLLMETNLTDVAEARLGASLRAISLLCKRTGARIPRVQPYWSNLQKELALPLAKRAKTEQLREAIDYLREISVDVEWPVADGKYWLWNVRPLYVWGTAPADRKASLAEWENTMVDVFGRCIDSAEEKVLFAVRFETGRNRAVLGSDPTQLEDKFRSRVYVQKAGKPALTIPCVQNHRNVVVEWTCRYDDRLPCSSDGATHPFCPLDRWWKRSTVILQTHSSKPAFVDRIQNAWARPGTPNGKHWDVYIQDAKILRSIGLAQVNVKQWNEEGCGKIDHVPKKKRGRSTAHVGWGC